MHALLKPLVHDLEELAHLSGVQSMLSWDQETYMPSGAIDVRSEQLSLLSKIHHDRFTGYHFKDLLSELIDLGTGAVKQPDVLSFQEKRLLEEVYKDWKKAVCLPTDFVSSFSQLCSKAQHVWQQARQDDDFQLFSPYLKKLVAMSKQKAAYIDSTKDPYDVLLDGFEPGMTVAKLSPIFQRLREATVSLLKKINTSNASFVLMNDQNYDVQKQWDFGVRVLKDMGFSFDFGRQDKSTHPFTTEFHPKDVRITTRFKESSLMEGLSSTIHEGGHALYEQGLSSAWFGTPLCESASLGIHESQSRLWEHYVGSSEGFWTTYLPILQSYFPDQLNSLSPDQFYKAINQVKPGLIRVEADEVTYNLHIMVRFEIEKLLFNGDVDMDQLPDIWKQKYHDYLGVEPTSYKEGLLQDVHWSCGLFGYFPTYTLGNLYGCQLFEQAKKDIPGLSTPLQSKTLGLLRDWLGTHIHSKGRLYSPEDLVKKVTDQPLSEQSFVAYLNRKYDQIYQLS